mmetsp:Transcript_4269/g.7061  ORF Transcript_4269/g.7061 Transcript_4269/m.7061 type:complete len:828 (-) Transcript_4269:28-2511(-)
MERISAAGEEDEEDDNFDDGEEGAAGEFADDEDGKVQRKLHLFQCPSVQQSIRRLWELLPKDAEGRLVMEGYVELNLRLQKSLCQDFVLERAVDSAIGDWGEDVREGQRAMVADEFAMFLFELCSLWCGPSISLLVYLLFLNAVFIAVTDARGAHTVGLRPLAGVERLPQSFFDLLHVQGWAKQPEDALGLDNDQALSAWLVRNLAPESEQSALLQVQRQVFQVTHDVRSVLLFQEKGGDREADILELVKQASSNLAKITPIEAHKLGDGAASTIAMLGQGPAGVAPGPAAELFPRPWCPSTHGKPPPAGPRLPVPLSPTTRRSDPRSGQGARSPRSRSQPQGQNTLASMLALTDSAHQHRGRQMEVSRPPIGRAYDTQRARPTASGLMLAGHVVMAPGAAKAATPQAMLAASPGSERAVSSSMEGSPAPGAAAMPVAPTAYRAGPTPGTPSSSIEARVSPQYKLDDIPVEGSRESRPSSTAGPSPMPPSRTWTSASGGRTSSQAGKRGPMISQASQRSSSSPLQSRTGTQQSQRVQVRSPSQGVSLPLESQSMSLSTAAGASAAMTKEVQSEIIASSIQGAGNVVDTPFAPPYKLPRNPADVFQKQTDPLLQMRPSSIVFNATKFHDGAPLVKEPFERVLRKLPADVRPGEEGPPGGPLSHPNEPVWFEMVHRLQGILKKQGRRAERRRKRKLRSKLFRGRSRTSGRKEDDGRKLREYFDRHAESRQETQGGSAPPGTRSALRSAGGEYGSEFLEKVHERYLVHRDRLESKPFRMYGLGGNRVGRRGVGELPERASHVVRPVYMPPPASMPTSPLVRHSPHGPSIY